MLDKVRARSARDGHRRLSPLGERLETRQYTTAPRTWVAGELVTAGMMNTIRDLFLELEAGTATFTKGTFAGNTTAALASMLSAATKACIAYDSTQNVFVASYNGAAYEALGGGGLIMAARLAMGMDA